MLHFIEFSGVEKHVIGEIEEIETSVPYSKKLFLPITIFVCFTDFIIKPKIDLFTNVLTKIVDSFFLY